ncbi:hypothetical protein N8475_06465 [Winogradskyella sp.]|nr:hypothetical protein [Winogradskyella sp.]
MKTKGTLIILSLVLFSSCIVKSLQPFYTKDSLSFNKNLVGNWVDNKNGKWTVASIKTKFEEDTKEGVTMSKEELELYETYKKGYYITYLKNEKEASFIAMPFKINDHFFIDFIPTEIDDNNINSLAAKHLIKTHSVAKIDINSSSNISFSWLSEERLTDLIDTNKIRLEHEKIGFEADLLLTATSKELYAFLKKYIKLEIEDKWKKADMLTLTKTKL